MPSDIEDRIRRGQYEDIYRTRVQASIRDPRTMTPDEIVDEIHSLRGTLQLATQRMIDLAQTLSHNIRRQPANEHTSSYINFANAWSRMAGACQQGMRRNETMNRLVKRAQMAQRDDYGFPPPPARPQPQPPPSKSRQGAFQGTNPLDGGQSMNDLLELYGQEIVRDAVRR